MRGQCDETIQLDIYTQDWRDSGLSQRSKITVLLRTWSQSAPVTLPIVPCEDGRNVPTPDLQNRDFERFFTSALPPEAVIRVVEC